MVNYSTPFLQPGKFPMRPWASCYDGPTLRILVLGATGHIGQAVVRRALAGGHEVTAVTRQTDPPSLRRLGVTLASIDEALSGGHDVVIDAAAPYPLGPSIPGSVHWHDTVASAVERTARIVEAARRNGSRLAFISSFTTIPRRESPLQAMESSWRRSVYPYFEAKAAMERTVVDAAMRGLAAVIVNPVVCLGPWEFRRDGTGFVRSVLAYGAPVVMDQTISVIDVRDVALAIDLALDRNLFGRPILLAGHSISIAALASRISALRGGTVAPIAVDNRLASAAAFWAGASFAGMGLRAPEFWGAIPLAAEPYPPAPSPEQMAIGLRLRPLEETLYDSVAFHLESA